MESFCIAVLFVLYALVGFKVGIDFERARTAVTK